jgi:hypothetical protein
MAQEFCTQLYIIKFHENPSRISRLISYVQTYRQTDGLSELNRHSTGYNTLRYVHMGCKPENPRADNNEYAVTGDYIWSPAEKYIKLLIIIHNWQLPTNITYYHTY